MTGFLALICLSIAGFGALLVAAREFRVTDAERVLALQQVRRANLVAGLAKMAQTKSIDYLRTGSAEARNGMSASFLELSGEHVLLKAQADVTVAAIDAAVLASNRLIDRTGSLSNPAAAIGQAAAQTSSASLFAVTARLQVSIGLMAGAASRLALSGRGPLKEQITQLAALIEDSVRALETDAAATPRLRKNTAVLKEVMDDFEKAVATLVSAVDLRTAESKKLDSVLQGVVDSAASNEASAAALFATASRRADAAMHELLTAFVIIALTVSTLGIACALVLGTSISRPIVALETSMALIAAGDFLATIPGLKRKDEIGRIANAVEVFKNNGLRLRHLNIAFAKAKAEAEEANISKTRFLAAASHDLLQPLNAARLYATSLRERIWTRTPTDESLNLALQVENSLGAVEDILSALLDISRLDAGAMSAEFSVFRLSESLPQLISEFDPIAKEKGLTLTFVRSSLLVRSDKRLLQRLLRNLLSNAVKYTPHGRVLVGVRRKSGMAHIQVWDTGIGIPKAKQRDIFREFERLPSSASTPGVGLGLSIVQRLSNVLDHKIILRSKPDCGSVFTVSLACFDTTLPHQLEAGIKAPTGQRSLRGLVIAAVDNEPIILKGIEALLGGWECIVVAAVDLGSLLTKLEDRRLTPDVLIVDYQLDVSDGITVVTTLRERFGLCQAVLITANRDPDVIEAARNSGIRFLNKPLKPAALRSLLSQWLAIKQSAS